MTIRISPKIGLALGLAGPIVFGASLVFEGMKYPDRQIWPTIGYGLAFALVLAAFVLMMMTLGSGSPGSAEQPPYEPIMLLIGFYILPIVYFGKRVHNSAAPPVVPLPPPLPLGLYVFATLAAFGSAGAQIEGIDEATGPSKLSEGRARARGTSR
ncbi:MAG: hypothetical protein AB7O37_01415 [Vicinamibacteria bacterium]